MAHDQRTAVDPYDPGAHHVSRRPVHVGLDPAVADDLVIIRGFDVGPSSRMSRPRERGSRGDGAEESTTIDEPERVCHGDLQGSS